MSTKTNDQKIKVLAYSGLLAAAIALATAFIKVPMIVGYVHLGDGLIFLTAALLGPIGAIASAIGSGLADLIAGYTIYIPATIIIKGLMSLIAAWGIKNNSSILRCILIFSMCEIIMVGGYFLYDAFLYDFKTAAAVILFNLVQGAAGVIIGAVLVPLFKKRLNNNLLN
ncbi:MAG: ECF transporter S component [Clostridia bacterium]|jgi:uncharacterized membrane protein|nr:ECF transporter S component [Clostridia bacterium]